MTRHALRADLLDFSHAPAWGSTGLDGVRYRPDHWLLVDGERIAGTLPGHQPPGPDWQQHDHRGQLLMPGFIDTHVHCPQLDVIASYGTGLLDWLNAYTFPAEQRYADPAVAREGAARFLDALLAHGTTTAVVFPTVHKVSAEALFDAASTRGMALVTGKVLMDRHAPPGLMDDVVGAERDCEDLIQRFHGQGRNRYAVTVRFAATSTPEQLAMAGALCRRHGGPGGVYMQTHVAENTDEVRWIAELFPEARSYLDVYHRHGLLHERAVLAHGIWLDAADRALLRDTGAQIAHSPTSNLFLGSGLFDWQAAVDTPYRVSLASDVGGGTSLSLLRTMAEAYKVARMTGQQLSAQRAFHLATMGGARALGLDDRIGSFLPGREADFVVLDPAATAIGARRDARARTLEERLFALMILGDDRNVRQTYIMGVPAIAGR